MVGSGAASRIDECDSKAAPARDVSRFERRNAFSRVTAQCRRTRRRRRSRRSPARPGGPRAPDRRSRPEVSMEHSNGTLSGIENVTLSGIENGTLPTGPRGASVATGAEPGPQAGQSSPAPPGRKARPGGCTRSCSPSMGTNGPHRSRAVRCRISARPETPFFSPNACQARLIGRSQKCSKNPPPTIALSGLWSLNNRG